jgi:hypothetical protein
MFRIYVFTVVARLVVGLIYCFVCWVLVIHQAECEADCLLSSITKIKNVGFISMPLVTLMVRYFGVELSADCI